MHLEVFIGAVDVPDFSWQESPADTRNFAVSPRIISDAIPDSYRIFWGVLERTKDEKYVSKAIVDTFWHQFATRRPYILVVPLGMFRGDGCIRSTDATLLKSGLVLYIEYSVF